MEIACYHPLSCFFVVLPLFPYLLPLFSICCFSFPSLLLYLSRNLFASSSICFHVFPSVISLLCAKGGWIMCKLHHPLCIVLFCPFFSSPLPLSPCQFGHSLTHSKITQTGERKFFFLQRRLSSLPRSLAHACVCA